MVHKENDEYVPSSFGLPRESVINLRNSPAWKVQPFANDAPTNHNLQVSVAGLSLSLLSIDL